MFEISKLKEKKLSELQEIAEKLKISKFKTLKKLDLVYKILDYQASNPEEKEVKQEESKEQPKSKFKAKAKTPKNKPDEKKSVDPLLFYDILRRLKALCDNWDLETFRKS